MSKHARWFSPTILAVLFLFLLSACDTGNSDEDITGTYQLKSMSSPDLAIFGVTTITAGQPVTFNIFGETGTLTLTGSLTLDSAKKYTLRATMATTGSENSTDTSTETGTYTVNGNKVTMSGTDDDGEPTTASGTIDGKRLTVTADGATIVFEK